MIQAVLSRVRFSRAMAMWIAAGDCALFLLPHNKTRTKDENLERMKAVYDRLNKKFNEEKAKSQKAEHDNN